MTLCRLIAPPWLMEQSPKLRKVLEGLFSDEQLKEYNDVGYNIYYLPNGPSAYKAGVTVDGSIIDSFNFVFVDMDLKDAVYPSKDAFLEAVVETGIAPTKVVDSGNGIHVYWKVDSLDAMSYLRLSRRLMRLLSTDEAVGQIFQLMRLPGFDNTKNAAMRLPCTLNYDSDSVYTPDQLHQLLPPITAADEAYCQMHFDKTYGLNQTETTISDKIPTKFGKMLKESHEAKELWTGPTDDRSKSDYRLGHLMFANGFTKDEAMSVLAQSAKALQRAPKHRVSYAENIVNKIWTFEQAEDIDKTKLPNNSNTVRELLAKGSEIIAGTRFPCDKLVDDTVHGFRLGQVIGIIGGSGVGKTTLTLNMFLWFAAQNPEYHHFFFSLEQPSGEIALRIKTICGSNESLFDQIHIVSNYGADGVYLNLSMAMIETHLLDFQSSTGLKIGATVVDHIGVLDKQAKNGENDGLIGVCRQMKAVAVKVNTMLIMLSQAPREKCGIGDLELDKSAAYGTVFFESFVDYCLCLWQPLKRVYDRGAPTVMAIKFAKIRHKKQGFDKIKEDVCYQFFFDPTNERIRSLTQAEEISAKFFVGTATTLRKADKKTDIVSYNSRRVEVPNAEKTRSSTGDSIPPTNNPGQKHDH